MCVILFSIIHNPCLIRVEINGCLFFGKQGKYLLTLDNVTRNMDFAVEKTVEKNCFKKQQIKMNNVVDKC